MTEETGNEAVTTINPGEEHWSTALVGDNAERAEALKAYEKPEDMLTAFDQAQDWRRGIAGDDDKYYADLQRFKSPTEYGNSFREAQQTIRSGNLKAALQENATEDDIKAYREANGIPMEASGYTENLPDGLVLGDADKQIFEGFAEKLHSINAPPEIAHAALEWYNGFAEEQQAQLAELDAQGLVESERELRGTWGADFTANKNLIEGWLKSTFGEAAKDAFMNGRDGEGNAWLNNPDILKGLAEVARKGNPVLELAGDTTTAQQTLNDEIAEHEKFMREHRTEYNNDVERQERLKHLYGLRIKQQEVA